MGLGYSSYEEALEARREWERRSKPLTRGSRLDRGKGLNPVNSERKKKEWERAYESEERVEWVQRQNCVACGDSPCENAHVAPPEHSGGMGRKADAKWIVPLCPHCHSVYHSAGRTSFENGNGLDLTRLARETDRKWRERDG